MSIPLDKVCVGCFTAVMDMNRNRRDHRYEFAASTSTAACGDTGSPSGLTMTESLWIQENYINATEGHGIGESDVYETRFDSPGELYRFCVKEFGRCVGKVYVDLPGKPATAVGWIFQGRDKYEDTSETYLREVWVSLHNAPDTVIREPHFRPLATTTTGTAKG